MKAKQIIKNAMESGQITMYSIAKLLGKDPRNGHNMKKTLFAKCEGIDVILDKLGYEVKSKDIDSVII